jgi:fermentation-respiration switch protein FrsA (DUF1100 family)
MAFDIAPKEVEDDVEYLRQTCHFVEDLLSTSLSFSLKSLEKDPDAFVKFHDATSMLRTLSLERIHRSSSEAVCIFMNLYHCLLQHALLLTINGPLNKVSCRGSSFTILIVNMRLTYSLLVAAFCWPFYALYLL